MADLATLKVKVDAADAVRQTKQLGDALKQTAMQGPLVSAAMGKSEAQIRRFAQAEAAAYREADKMAAAMKKVETEVRGVGRSAENTSRSVNLLRTAFAAVIGSRLIRELVTFADTAKLVSARLNLVTANVAELARVEESLFSTAQRTGSAYQDVAGLYVRVARNMRELGRSESELLKFAELVNMQLQIAGATTTEAATGVQQLGQALSKGKLNGDEFRTVLEAMPTVADALTAALAGGVRAELFKLAEQGKITGTDVVGAVNAMEQATREKMTQLPMTIGKAFTIMRNDALKAIGDIDNRLNASSVIATTLQGFGVLFRVAAAAVPQGMPWDDRPVQRMVQVLADVRKEMSGVVQSHADVASAAVAAFLRTQQAADASAEAARKAYQERYDAWKQEKQNAEDRKRWEEEELARTKAIAFARARARMEAGGGIPAATAGITRFESAAGSVRAELARQDAERAAARERQSFESRVRGAAFGGVDIKGIVAKALPELSALQVTMLEEKLQLETDRNKQIAQNFQENMQRAFGDIMTEFVNTGKVSVREIFNTMRSLGGSLIGQGISSGIQGLFGGTMTAMQSILTGGALLGIGSLFGGNRNRAPRESYEQRMAKAQAQYASIEMLRQQRADEMRKFVEGRTAGRGGVVQSVGTVLQETTASRMIGELVAIRVATTRTADAVSGNGSAAGTTVNVTVQGGVAGDVRAVGASVAEAVDRMLGSRVQALRLTSGTAVTT